MSWALLQIKMRQQSRMEKKGSTMKQVNFEETDLIKQLKSSLSIKPKIKLQRESKRVSSSDVAFKNMTLKKALVRQQIRDKLVVQLVNQSKEMLTKEA